MPFLLNNCIFLMLIFCMGLVYIKIYLCLLFSHCFSSKCQDIYSFIHLMTLQLPIRINAWIYFLTCRVYQKVSVSELTVSLTG